MISFNKKLIRKIKKTVKTRNKNQSKKSASTAIANSVMKLNEDIDEVAKSFEVTVAKVKKCVRELNRNARTLNFMWQKAKENRS